MLRRGETANIAVSARTGRPASDWRQNWGLGSCELKPYRCVCWRMYKGIPCVRQRVLPTTTSFSIGSILENQLVPRSTIAVWYIIASPTSIELKLSIFEDSNKPTCTTTYFTWAIFVSASISVTIRCPSSCHFKQPRHLGHGHNFHTQGMTRFHQNRNSLHNCNP